MMFNNLVSIFKNFFSFLNNDVYLNLIGVLFTSILSYRAAKYSASKSNKLKIKQLQFNDVYLPLFRLLENVPEKPSKLQIIDLHKKISNILDKNYALAFPQLHSLNNELRNCLLNDTDFTKTLKSITHQVRLDYELLKKQLGYPSDSFYKIFIRMTLKQKAIFIVSWLNVFSIFFLMLLLGIQVKNYNGDSFSFAIFTFAEITVFLVVILKINKVVNNLND